jgi:hypothetical protein
MTRRFRPGVILARTATTYSRIKFDTGWTRILRELKLIKTAILMLVLVIGTLIAQDTKVQAVNSVVDATGGSNQMPNEKCRRESAQNNDAERAARYDQCMARKPKGQR